MILRPGWNLLGVAAAGVLVAALAFYVPSTAWLLLPFLIAAVILSVFDALWLRRHQSDLVVTRDVPRLAGRDVPFDVTLRCTNNGLSRLRGSVREVAPTRGASALVVDRLSGGGNRPFGRLPAIVLRFRCGADSHSDRRGSASSVLAGCSKGCGKRPARTP